MSSVCPDLAHFFWSCSVALGSRSTWFMVFVYRFIVKEFLIVVVETPATVLCSEVNFLTLNNFLNATIM